MGALDQTTESHGREGRITAQPKPPEGFPRAGWTIHTDAMATLGPEMHEKTQ
jgi:hypothetical protein